MLKRREPLCGHRLGGELGEGRGASRQSCTEGEGEARALQAGGGGGGLEGGKGSQVWSALRQGSWGGWAIPPPSGVPGIQRACLPRCPPLFCRIKTRSSPRLNFFPQIRQIQTSKTVDGESHQGKCSLGPGGGGRFLKMAIDFGMWRVGLGSCPGPRPGPHGFSRVTLTSAVHRK